MTIALVGHTKVVVGNIPQSTSVTSPAINTTGANFIALFYTFYNGGDYPQIVDNKGNTYYAFARKNAFSPALACEMRFTKQVVVGSGHTWTVSPSGLYPSLNLDGMTLYIAAFSGVQSGSDSNPNFFSAPWYGDFGNNCPPPYITNTSLSTNTGQVSPAGNGYLHLMGWGNTDPNHNTVVSATDGLSGTPTFAITDSNKFDDVGNNYNAGLAYYVQPVGTSVTVTQTWIDNVGFSGGGSWGVMSTGIFLPGAPTPPVSSTKRAKVKWF